MTAGVTFPGLSGISFVNSAHDEVCDLLRDNSTPNIIFGAGLTGGRMLDACRALGVPVTAFADNNPVKTNFRDLPVSTPPKTVAAFPNARFLLAVTDVKPALRQLRSLGVSQVFSAGVLSRVSGVVARPPEFGDAFADYVLAKNCLSHQQYQLEHFESGAVKLPNLDIMITERCSLNCIHCSTLMPYYQKRHRAGHLSADRIMREISAMCSCIDAVSTLYIIGGEPLLHPEFPAITRHAAEQPNIDDVCIITNGTVLPKEGQWEALRHEKIYVQVSNYGPLSTKLDAVVAGIRRHGIAGWCKEYREWTCFAPTAGRGLGNDALRRLLDSCLSSYCLPLRDGRLYRCEYAANANRLGFMPDAPDNYVDIGPVMRGEAAPRSMSGSIGAFVYDLPVIPACDYCFGNDGAGEKVAPAEQCPGTLPGP